MPAFECLMYQIRSTRVTTQVIELAQLELGRRRVDVPGSKGVLATVAAAQHQVKHIVATSLERRVALSHTAFAIFLKNPGFLGAARWHSARRIIP